jgi:hypothetical protein
MARLDFYQPKLSLISGFFAQFWPVMAVTIRLSMTLPAAA